MVTNTKVAPLYLDKVINALTVGNPNVSVESVILPDGEQYKNMVITFIKISSLFSHVFAGSNGYNGCHFMFLFDRIHS